MSPARSQLSPFRAWWPAVVWVVIICFESSDMFSSRNTGSLLFALIVRIYGEVSFYDFLIFHMYLRKTGHVLGYGMLALLLLRGWRATLGQVPELLRRSTLWAWLGTVFVASMDELHQSYIPSRTGTWRDVVLDSTAGLVFLFIAYIWLRRAERKKVQSKSAQA